MDTYLAADGDPDDPLTFSGTTRHFGRAAQHAGLIDGSLATSSSHPTYRNARLVWTAKRLLRGKRPGGFKVSPGAMAHIWSRVRLDTPCRVVNAFQLWPSAVVDNDQVEKWSYIDQTLDQLFRGYEYGERVDPELAETAIASEKAGYAASAGFLTHCHWAARNLVDSYGVPEAKVHVVNLGINIDPDRYERWADSHRLPDGLDGPLKMVFVGKFWHRKGLDRLLEGLALAREGGAEVELTVVGCDRRELPEGVRDTPGVRWLGFVDKHASEVEFMDLVASHHVGCLLSRYEAGAVALREYHALGLAVLGTTAGGCPELVIPEASVLLTPEADSNQVAEAISMLATDRQRLDEMRYCSWERRRSTLWSVTVEQMQDLWPH